MASNATASATHSGCASVSRSRTSPSPGASSSTRPTTASTATIWSVRLASLLGSNSSGIVTSGVWSIGSTRKLRPSAVLTSSRAIRVSHPPADVQRTAVQSRHFGGASLVHYKRLDRAPRSVELASDGCGRRILTGARPR